MRLATWNVNSIKARLPRLLDWLRETGPDVVCLQETKVPEREFPYAELQALGYETAAHGDGRWNGVALLSRVGLADVRTGLVGQPGYPEPGTLEARAVGATCGGVRLWSVYVPNGRAVDDPHYAYKLAWLGALRKTVAAELRERAAGPVGESGVVGGSGAVGESGVVGGPGVVGGSAAADGAALAVCGDFNIAPTDADVWDPALFATSTHVTPAERAALSALRELGLHDVVPLPQKGPHPYTYWDYRAGAFPKDWGMRIDLVYATATISGAVRSAYVDRQARKGKGPSDHAPVVVDFDSVGADLVGPDLLRPDLMRR